MDQASPKEIVQNMRVELAELFDSIALGSAEVNDFIPAITELVSNLSSRDLVAVPTVIKQPEQGLQAVEKFLAVDNLDQKTISALATLLLIPGWIVIGPDKASAKYKALVDDDPDKMDELGALVLGMITVDMQLEQGIEIINKAIKTSESKLLV